MGLSNSWIGVAGKPPAEALAELGLRDTGEPDPEYFAAAAAGVLLPSGWYVIVSDDLEYASPARMAPLSKGCRILGCAIEEHVMYMQAWLFADGKQEWSVTHNAQKSIQDLSSEGILPPEFAAIAADARRRQADDGDDVDHLSDVPLALAAVVTGFRHDEFPEDAEPGFTRLEPIAAAGKTESTPKRRGLFGLFSGS